MGQCNFLHLWHQKLYRAFRFGTLWPISCSYPKHSQLTRHSLMLANGRIRQSLTALVNQYNSKAEVQRQFALKAFECWLILYEYSFVGQLRKFKEFNRIRLHNLSSILIMKSHYIFHYPFAHCGLHRSTWTTIHVYTGRRDMMTSSNGNIFRVTGHLCREFTGTRSKKTSKLRVTGLCEGTSPVIGEFPSQRASDPKNVSIWWRHHVHEISRVTLQVYILIPLRWW